MQTKEDKGAIAVIELPLVTEPWQVDKLNKSFTHMVHLYNKLIEISKELYDKVCKEHKTELDEISAKLKELYSQKTKENESEIKKLAKPLYKQRQDIFNNFATTDRITKLAKNPNKVRSVITEYGLIDVCNAMLKYHVGGTTDKGVARTYSDLFPQINTAITNALAKRAYNAWETFLYSNGEEIHFKPRDKFNCISFSFKNENPKGFCFIDLESHKLILRSKGANCKIMSIPFLTNRSKGERGIYEEKALSSKIATVGIRREIIRGKYKFYLQISYYGTPYRKGKTIGNGTIGADPGVNHYTAYGDKVFVLTPTEEMCRLEKKKKDIQRKMDRSQRISNPDNYNEDGTIKRGRKGKKYWVHSKNYMKLKAESDELQRRFMAIRDAQIQLFANDIATNCNVLNVEENDIHDMAKKKKATQSPEEKTERKKSFGKSIIKFAPAMVTEAIVKKVTALGGQVNEIKAVDAKASGTDHTKFTKGDDFSTYKKEDYYTKETKRNVTLSNGNTHNRDTHAAFNLKHFNAKTKQYNIKEMRDDYQHFCEEEKKAVEKNQISL